MKFLERFFTDSLDVYRSNIFLDANWHNFCNYANYNFNMDNCTELHSFSTLNHISALRMLRLEKVPAQLVFYLSFPFL